MTKLKEKLIDKTRGIGDNLVIVPRDRNAGAKTAPGKLLEFGEISQEMQGRIDALEHRLLQVGEGGVKKIPLSKLHKVDGRQRSLTEEERNDLRENLRTNILITPITVTKRSDGEFDIVAGNNRYDIYIELGREDIEAFEIDIDDEQADVSAFYSNLLHPSLPDFEKFKGFKRRMVSTGKSQSELAKESGIAESALSNILSYDRLPAGSIKLLEDSKIKLGATAASDLAKLTDKGRGGQVLKAISLMITNGITQAAAISLASKDESKVATAKKVPLKIKSGKSNFAEIHSIDKTLRISFSSSSQREAVETEILEIIKKHAALENTLK